MHLLPILPATSGFRKNGIRQILTIADPRNLLPIKNSVVDMPRQRVYGLAQGWEDLNDEDTLCSDVAMQTAVRVDDQIARAQCD